jgi:hypothetical protein
VACRAGAHMPKSEGVAGLRERIGDVSRTVVDHHPPVVDPLAVEQSDGTAKNGDHISLCPKQNIEVSQPGGVVDGDTDLVIANAIEAPYWRSPVMQWPTFLNRGRVLMSSWIM